MATVPDNSGDLALVKLDAARRMLAEAKDVYDLVDIRDQAATVQTWLRRRDASLDDENRAAELRVRAEREIGKQIKESPVSCGRPTKKRYSESTILPEGVSKNQSSQYQRMADVPDGDFEQHIAEAKSTKERITTKGVAEIGMKPHVARATGENEWYTPAEYIEAARAVMGGIDCDPASSEIANRIVQADRIYTKDDSGLAPCAVWGPRVWMNPPYAQPLVSQFAEALATRVRQGEVKAAIVLVNNATETEWFHALLSVASAACFPKGRIRFLNPDGNPSGAPLQGQAVLYVGANVGRFAEQFGRFGKVLFR